MENKRECGGLPFEIQQYRECRIRDRTEIVKFNDLSKTRKLIEIDLSFGSIEKSFFHAKAYLYLPEDLSCLELTKREKAFLTHKLNIQLTGKTYEEMYSGFELYQAKMGFINNLYYLQSRR